MLKIGEFSKLSRISVRMLRHYDDLGLLRPVETDRFTGYRYYSPEQLQTAARIRTLRDMGFGLSAIGEILPCYGDRERLDAFFQIREAELRAAAAETAYRLRLLDTARKQMRKDTTSMDYNIAVKTIPQRTVASLRMTLPSYEAEGMAWDILMRETEPLHPVPDDPCLCCVLFHDDEYKESDVDIEIQKTVRGTYPDTEHVVFKTEPALTVASAIHTGPYSGLDTAMGAVARWVQDNGYTLTGPVLNIYHVSPHETQDPEQFVTEICYAVKQG